MGGDFTAADQAFLLIDVVATLAALFVSVFWILEKCMADFKSRPSREVALVRAWVRKTIPK